MELAVQNINKSYSEKKVLNNMSFILKEGIYGLLGPNGAGKTTLMNILTTNLDQDAGNVLYNGREIKSMGWRYRAKIGYAPQQQWMYEEFRAIEYLHYFAALKGIQRKKQKERVEEVLKKMNLLEVKNHKIKTFSGGMKQRLLLAQAMLNHPKILILDEPTAGLDPKERIRIRNLISESSKDSIVILATHVVSDVECIAKKILLLKQGELLKMDSPENLIKSLEGHVYTVVTSEEEAKNLQNICMVSNVHVSSGGFYVRIVGESPISLEKRQMVQPTLEDVYLYWMGEDVN